MLSLCFQPCPCPDSPIQCLAISNLFYHLPSVMRETRSAITFPGSRACRVHNCPVYSLHIDSILWGALGSQSSPLREGLVQTTAFSFLHLGILIFSSSPFKTSVPYAQFLEHGPGSIQSLLIHIFQRGISFPPNSHFWMFLRFIQHC